MKRTEKKAFIAVTAFAAVATMMGGLAVIAAPPGTLDGQNIPSDFGAPALVTTQTNTTGYGDQSVSGGALTAGTELDVLYLAKTATELRIGIAGNIKQLAEDPSDHYVIFIGGTGNAALGQTELMAQGVDGPPFTVQTLSQQELANTNGAGPEDDTCEISGPGTILPCAMDYAIGIDAWGGTVSVSEYTLYADSNGTHDCDGDGAGTALSSTFAARRFVTQTTVDDPDETASNPQGLGYDVIGIENTNVAGVTSESAASAASASTGLEMAIPFAALGLTGNETISMFVMLSAGNGFVSNQAFPAAGGDCASPGTRPNYQGGIGCADHDVDCNGSTNAGDILVVRSGLNWNQAVGDADEPRCDVDGNGTCNAGDILVIRSGLNWNTSTGPCDCGGGGATGSCMSLNLATLPTFGGGDNASDGFIDAADYGAAAVDTQTCPTDFGDQILDPGAVTITNGSELNQMFVTNDADYLYVGITGNIPGSGSSDGMLLFIESGQVGGMGGNLPLDFTAGGRVQGMSGGPSNGHLLPLTPADAVVDYDYALELNRSDDTIWTDFADLTADSREWWGQNGVGSNGLDYVATNGALAGYQMAYNPLNSNGVFGGQEENTTGVAEVMAQAATATYGFEFQIPLTSIGITSLPAEVNLWAFIVNSDGEWVSNQSLPSLRDPSGVFNGGANVHNGDNLQHDYSNDGLTPHGDEFGYFARSANVTLNP